MSEPRPSAKKRVFRPQFSLRTLLIAVTGLSVVLGSLSYEARRQRRIVAELEQLGADIEFSSDQQTSVWIPAMLDTGILDRIEGVISVDPDFTDLNVLREFKNLRTLGIHNVQDSDMALLKQLKKLNRLLLHDPRVRKVASFEGLENLEYLHFHQSLPSDEDEEKLSELTEKLHRLRLDCHIRGTATTRSHL